MSRVSFESSTTTHSVDILGNYTSGERLGRDGITVIDTSNEFGMEWQVQDSEPSLFHEAKFPQHPEKCVMPSGVTGRRLREAATVSYDEASTACSHVDGEELESCIYDVQATGDIDMAMAY